MTEADFGFTTSFNMGYEGFSKPLPLSRMNPVYGNRGEIFIILGLFALAPLIKNSRKKNEDALRSEVKANNRFAEVHLNADQRKLVKWTL